MQIEGPRQRGHVLLVAGDAAVRRRAVQVAPSANLAALGVVPVAGLLNSDAPGDTTYLDGVRDPNTVLTRLRTAAATPGPLFVYLSGRLTVDRRAHRLHLALAGTTSASVRWTALPWDWLGGELRDRPPGLTTLLLDLVADRAAWPLLQEYGGPPETPTADVYGVVRPPGSVGGGNTVSSYTRHWIDQLHSNPTRPDHLRLHALAVGAAALPPGSLVLPTARALGTRPRPVGPPAAGAHATGPAQGFPVPAPEPSRAADVPVPERDPRAHIHALATSGRHPEAADLAGAWEQHVLRTRGSASDEALEWLEIRADLARMADDFPLATRLWITAGRTRLARQPADAPEVRAAATGALHCWTRLKDPDTATRAGLELLDLLRSLPHPNPDHLRLAEQRMELLNRAPSPTAAGG
ncbi:MULTISPECIES: hypothetical protein [unclassified Streptomyces]|uniref:hypothetical protein n=1 Tax=unclassified Streptomyces TaxID=2593676 RepID=UPI0029BCBB01|nr:hypothetical protein [Streptomyces sp. DK15]MDX2391298.1 hypothetical protein [Streptomyces sp. DK15]